MTYGNTSITTASNGEAVFDFFDDFNSFDPSKWQQGTIANTGGTNWSYYGGSLIGGNIRRYQQSAPTFSGAKIVETRQREFRSTVMDIHPIGFRAGNNNGATILHHRCGSNRVYTRSDGVWQNHGNASYLLGQWVRSSVAHSGSIAYYRRYLDGGVTPLLNIARSVALSPMSVFI